MQTLLMSDEKQFFKVRQGFDKAQWKFFPRLPKDEFIETAVQIREASNIIQVIECDVQAPHRSEMPQKVQVPARSAIYVELDVRPVESSRQHVHPYQFQRPEESASKQ